VVIVSEPDGLVTGLRTALPAIRERDIVCRLSFQVKVAVSRVAVSALLGPVTMTSSPKLKVRG